MERNPPGMQVPETCPSMLYYAVLLSARPAMFVKGMYYAVLPTTRPTMFLKVFFIPVVPFTELQESMCCKEEEWRIYLPNENCQKFFLVTFILPSQGNAPRQCSHAAESFTSFSVLWQLPSGLGKSYCHI